MIGRGKNIRARQSRAEKGCGQETAHDAVDYHL